MKFIHQFNAIVNSKEVRSSVDCLLKEGVNSPIFLNYFGVNYSKNNLVSVKLYFSFFEKPSDIFLNEFGISEKYKELIFNNWIPSKTYDFMHQGLTFGLKCYLKNDEIIINKYLHFRTPNIVLGMPNEIKLFDEDKFYPGICMEFHENRVEEKKYFYINSTQNINKLLQEFSFHKQVAANELHQIEFTESNEEKKVNLIFKNTESISKLLKEDDNWFINELNRYFFEKYKLYYYGYGKRLDKDVNALYFVPKEVLTSVVPFQILPLIFKQ